MIFNRRDVLIRLGMAATMLAGAMSFASAQDDIESIKIGAVYPKTGPQAGGAAASHIPNIELWVHDVNEKGGLMLSSIGKRVPIEVIAYDDRTSNEDTVRLVNRLINQDKVDFLLSPYGTAAVLAAAPLFHRYNYPLLAVSAVTDRYHEFAKRWPNSFWLIGGGSDGASAIVNLLSELREKGELGNKVAMVSVADAFGIDLANAGRTAFKEAGFDLVVDTSYPLGSQDLAPVINEVKRAEPDAFVAFSYPPDTFALTDQAIIADFNPTVFYTGIGTFFPGYRDKYGAATEGVMGIGGWEPETPDMKAYIERHIAVTGKEPDAWSSSVLYASYQMLGQAIENVGSLDREAVIKELQTGSFDTVIGEVKLNNNVREGVWWAGQWQDGAYHAVAPTELEGARDVIVPKPAWPEQ